MDKWQRINFLPNLKLENRAEGVTSSDFHRRLSKDTAKEGMVLLKNSGNTLPLNKGASITLFGKASFDYVKGGGGSGDVTVSYVTNLYEGFRKLSDFVSIYEPVSQFYKNHVNKEYAKGKLPGLVNEPIIDEDLIKRSSISSDTAVISFCRFSGEGWDRKSSKEQKVLYAEPGEIETAKQSSEIFEEGDFYLSSNEKSLIEKVKRYYKKIVVVMNVGGMIDSSWFYNDDSIGSVLMAWQGGMEGGLAAAELLCGIGNPSGKLTDTFAKELSDYPSTESYHESMDFVNYTEDIFVGYRYFETIPGADKKVNYPFGFGLSYSEFEVGETSYSLDGNILIFRTPVTNIGEYPGREVLQIYSMPPEGLLTKPKKELKGFRKSRFLKPGECQLITIKIEIDDLASYDDRGDIKKSAWLLEKGEYKFFLGTSVRDGSILKDSYNVPETVIINQLTPKIQPVNLNKRLLADGSYEPVSDSGLEKISPSNPVGDDPELKQPDYRYFRGGDHCGLPDSVITLKMVYDGKSSIEEFMEQLTLEDLVHLTGGQPNTGVANTYGWGNIPEYGIPNAMTVDGPAGVRINRECGVCTTAWPCATLLASTWAPGLVERVGIAGAKEVKENNLAVWLTPAINIHRSPLCGRNFEYYSEDPLLTGKIGTAMVKGIQSCGIAATVKHFAFNNKETNRKNSDSRVSERAAREIYLKGFEIIVKEADPWSIMSAYNMVNGERTSECRELLEDILRDEWNFKGVVTTDWWTRGDHDKEIMAGNDIKMGSGYPEDLIKAVEEGRLDPKLLKKSVRRVLQLLLKLD